jgi:hypothetical protein
MNSKENVKVTGRLIITLRDEQGVVKDTREINNLVVTTGLSHIASRIAGNSVSAMSHMAVGTGTTAVAASNTALVTETARIPLASTTPGTANIVYVANFGPGVGTGALTEAGLFNNSSGGILLCRTVFPAFNKLSDDTMTINWTVNLAGFS